MIENIHIITQGDRFLSQFALALQESGHTVSCSDFAPEIDNISRTDIILNSLSHYVAEGGTVDILVIPEGYEGDDLSFAVSEHIPVISAYDLLATIIEDKVKIIECNSRSAGRISSLIVHALQTQSKKVDYVLDKYAGNRYSGVFFSENTRICLLDGDFLLQRDMRNCKSDILILSSMRWKESTLYPTFEDYLEARHKLITTINRNGILIYNQSVTAFQEWADTLREDITSIPFKPHRCRRCGGVSYLSNGKIEMEMPFDCDDDILCDISAAQLACRQLGIADRMFYDSLLSVDFLS